MVELVKHDAPALRDAAQKIKHHRGVLVVAQAQIAERVKGRTGEDVALAVAQADEHRRGSGAGQRDARRACDEDTGGAGIKACRCWLAQDWLKHWSQAKVRAALGSREGQVKRGEQRGCRGAWPGAFLRQQQCPASRNPRLYRRCFFAGVAFAGAEDDQQIGGWVERERRILQTLNLVAEGREPAVQGQSALRPTDVTARIAAKGAGIAPRAKADQGR